MLKNSRKKHVRNFLLAVIIDESLKYFQFIMQTENEKYFLD